MNFKQTIFLGAILAESALMPVITFAHNGVEDGDGPDLPDTSAAAMDERKKVGLIFVVGVLIVAGILWYIRKKNTLTSTPTPPPAA